MKSFSSILEGYAVVFNKQDRQNDIILLDTKIYINGILLKVNDLSKKTNYNEIKNFV